MAEDIYGIHLLTDEDVLKMQHPTSVSTLESPKENVELEILPELGKPIDPRSDTLYIKKITGIRKNGVIRFPFCHANHYNYFHLDGSPLMVRKLSYYFQRIGWSAGRGWPWYSERCPRTDLGGAGFWYPDEKRHQIIMVFGGYRWASCSNSDAGTGKEVNQVKVLVNDDRYIDNTGTFEVVVTGYSM